MNFSGCGVGINCRIRSFINDIEPDVVNLRHDVRHTRIISKLSKYYGLNITVRSHRL